MMLSLKRFAAPAAVSATGAISAVAFMGFALTVETAAQSSPGCRDVRVQGGGVTFDGGTWNPLTTPNFASPTQTIVIENTTAGDCQVTLGVLSAPPPATLQPIMFNGTEQLTYGLRPVTSETINVAGNSSASVSYVLDFAASQNPNVTAGRYIDQNVNEVHVFEGATASAANVLDVATFSASVAVESACELPVPSATSLSFTSAISQGLPNAGVELATQFTGVRCTNPANVSLSGDAMKPVSATASISGFDNFINFEASATFASATATLQSDADVGEETVTSAAHSGAATDNGTIDVSVRLLAGNPILAGSYASVLTVGVDPIP